MIGGAIGGLIGLLGAMLGLSISVMADSRSTQPLTYWPSRSSPWKMRDWAAHLTLLGSYLTLLFCLIYAVITFGKYLSNPSWYVVSILALNA